MRKKSLSSYIFFGTTLRYLEDIVRLPTYYIGDNYISYNIEVLLIFFEENQMKVSQNASGELALLKEELDGKYKPKDLCEEDDRKKISDCIKKLRFVVMSEAPEVVAFFPNEKRFNIEFLLEDTQKIFGEETFKVLPEFSQYELSESCKCIAFERGTASAFHLMRGVEALIRHWYQHCVKRNRVDPMMWANMVKHLIDRKKVSNDAVRLLDLIRLNYRNPTAHPDKVYSVDEAQDLLGACVPAIASIVREPSYPR